MWVTCYSDASFRAGQGAWGVYVRSSEGKIESHGLCPSWVTNVNVAELYAMFVGIGFIAQAWGEIVTGVLVCSDSKNALRWINRSEPISTDAAVSQLQESIEHLMQKWQLRTKWVQGHQHYNGTAGVWVQKRCDQLAGKARHEEKAKETTASETHADLSVLGGKRTGAGLGGDGEAGRVQSPQE